MRKPLFILLNQLVDRNASAMRDHPQSLGIFLMIRVHFFDVLNSWLLFYDSQGKFVVFMVNSGCFNFLGREIKGAYLRDRAADSSYALILMRGAITFMGLLLPGVDLLQTSEHFFILPGNITGVLSRRELNMRLVVLLVLSEARVV